MFLSNLYNLAFESTKARHILFAYTLNQTIDFIRNQLRNKKAYNSLISIEEKQLELLTNLRFKHFFISIVGKCMEVLLDKKIESIKQVGFTVNESSNTLQVLQADLLPVINFILSVTCSNIDNFQKVMEDKNSLINISKNVSAILYASLISSNNPIIEKFRKIMIVD